MDSVLFYDPVLAVVATPLEYATGASNGHPAIPLADAVKTATGDIRRQVEVNTDHILQLTQLVASIDENVTISSLRHREAAVQVRSFVDDLVTALRKHEEHLLATIERDAEIMRRDLESRRASVRAAVDELTTANNVLTDFTAASGTAAASHHSLAADNGDAAQATETAEHTTSGSKSKVRPLHPDHAAVLRSLRASRQTVAASSRYEFADDTAFDVRGPASVTSAVAELLSISTRPSKLYVVPATITASRGNEEKTPASKAADVAKRPDEHIYECHRDARAAKTESTKRLPRGVVHLLGTVDFAQPAEPAKATYEDPLKHHTEGLDIVPSVPVTNGDASNMTQRALFVHTNDDVLGLGTCRLASVLGATLWYDFGSAGSVAPKAYSLMHGAATRSCALRSWSALGTNEHPLILSAAECSADPQGAAHRLAEFATSHCVVLDQRDRDTRFGNQPYDVVHLEMSKPAQTFFRYLGIRIDGPNAAGAGHYQIQLAGVEWFGTYRHRG
jgi:polyhydroxyalkanoate synthesis regulator phasin